MSEALTKEEIDKYIELDYKIKERIIDVNCILSGIPESFIQSKVNFSLSNRTIPSIYDINKFVNNVPGSNVFTVCSEYADCEYEAVEYNRNFLYMKDEDLEAIRKDYQEELRKEKEEAEKSQEDHEYKEYLRLKCKFENGGKHYIVRSSNAETTEVSK